MNIKSIIGKNQGDGQSLIEILIALSSLVLIISAITIVTINSLNNSLFIKNQNLANKYAQEAMEFIRNWQKGSGLVSIDNKNYSFQDFIKILSPGGESTYCLADIGAGATPQLTTPLGPDCSVNLAAAFKRKIVFNLFPSGSTSCGGSDMMVKSIVSWTSSKCLGSSVTYCHSSQIISCFSNPVIKAIP